MAAESAAVFIWSPMKVLVTGGGGFLGGAVVRRLLHRGDRVASFHRGLYPELTAVGVHCIRGDLANVKDVAQAVQGCDAVIQVAAKAGVWGPYEDYYRANVLGTRNIIEACRSAGVPRLVFTSSPSVVFSGRDENGVDETAPYPASYLAHYPATKAEAERLVLAANGPNLATVALRPHLIWGPGDSHLLPRLADRAAAGKLRLVRRENLVDSTYIDNAAHAHELALDRLVDATSAPAGRAYFISNGEPRPMAALINELLATQGMPPITRTISPGMAYAAGAVLEFVHRLLPGLGEPPLTRFVARQLATAHWFDLSAAKRDLGYRPLVSHAEGLARLENERIP